MDNVLVGVLNQTNQRLHSHIIPTSNLVGNLNVYTMLTGDGRELELSIVSDSICWRRVGDTNWIPLVPLSSISPVKGVDYFTQEDVDFLLTQIDNSLGDGISIDAISGLQEALDTKASEDTLNSLIDAVSHIIQDKHYTHRQSVASSRWTIHHNLEKMPAVIVTDSSGNIVVGEILYTDMNTLSIVFSGSFSGLAYLN